MQFAYVLTPCRETFPRDMTDAESAKYQVMIEAHDAAIQAGRGADRAAQDDRHRRWRELRRSGASSRRTEVAGFGERARR